MDIIAYSKLKKCISVDINSGHSFATTTDRDTFFTTNPTQLKANMYIYCNGQLQQYINSAWEVRSTAIKGSKGDKGDKGDAGIDGTNGTNGIDGVDGVGIQSVVDNGNNTFTITLTNGTPTIIDKIDTINSDVVTQGTTNLYLTPTQVNKLTNIEENAEVNNISDANATDLTDSGDTTLHYHTSDRDRTNHTGTQAITTVTGLQTALDNKTNKNFTLYTQKTTVDNDDKIAINDSIDSNAVKYVTLNQLVSSVQDPHNKGYYATGVALNTVIPTATDGDFAVVGETNTIWVWNGTAFIDSSASGAVLSVNGRTGVITLTKADVGLDNVVNLDTSTTANITDSTDKRFVTDANLVVLGNTSGTNTGDETNSTIKTKLGTDLSNKVDKVTGKSLISDSEITRLASVVNYNDTAVQAHMSDTAVHVTADNKTTWNSKANGTHTHVKADITDFPTIPPAYTLPTASTTVLGGVKVDGTSITIADGVISALGGGGGVTVDVALSASSTNPVQNKAVYTALAGKADTGHVQAVNKGGTGQTSYTVGDILYANTTSTLAKLAAGTLGKVLTAKGAGTAPAWETPSSGGGITQTLLFSGAVNNTDVYTLSAAYTGFKFLLVAKIVTVGESMSGVINCNTIIGATNYVPSYGVYIGTIWVYLQFNTNGVNFKVAASGAIPSGTYKIYGVK